MRVALADPPYIGQARKHYAKEAAADGRVASEVDHRALLADLMGFEAWALCLSAPTLEEMLHLAREVCGPNVVRVGAWVKPFASFKPGVNPGYCWEPVLFHGGRKLGREVPTVRDYLHTPVADWVSSPITLRRGVSGAKPDAFSYWIFDLLGLEPGDEFHDLFPGSGAVSRAWSAWSQQTRIA
jgi:hypothetical protein